MTEFPAGWLHQVLSGSPPCSVVHPYRLCIFKNWTFCVAFATSQDQLSLIFAFSIASWITNPILPERVSLLRRSVSHILS